MSPAVKIDDKGVDSQISQEIPDRVEYCCRQERSHMLRSRASQYTSKITITGGVCN